MKRGLGRQTLPLFRGAPAAVPHGLPNVQPDSAPCPLRARSAPTRGAFPLSASFVPRLRCAQTPLGRYRGRGDHSLHPARPSGFGSLGAGPGQESSVPTFARAARDALPGHPPGGPEPSGGRAGSAPVALAPGPGSWWLRRRLLLQEGAESSDFLLKGQLPPIDHTQRASSRQHPSQPLSLPPRLRPWSLAPPRMRSGGRGPGPAL